MPEKILFHACQPQLSDTPRMRKNICSMEIRTVYINELPVSSVSSFHSGTLSVDGRKTNPDHRCPRKRLEPPEPPNRRHSVRGGSCVPLTFCAALPTGRRSHQIYRHQRYLRRERIPTTTGLEKMPPHSRHLACPSIRLPSPDTLWVCLTNIAPPPTIRPRVRSSAD